MGKEKDITMTDFPKVTIMIPTYNQEAYIGEAVKSALMQTYPNLEIVVGDDCSTDTTAEQVSAIKDSRLKLVRNSENLGRTGNYRNLLCNHATGEFVVNLDGDDYYTDPEFISEAIKLINNDPDIVIVAARAEWYSGNRVNVSKVPTKKELSGLEILRRLPEYELFFQHMATLYKKEVAIKLDFYRFDVISSDWESLYRLVLCGKVRYLNEIVGVWRIHGENETGLIDFEKFIKNLSIWPSIFNEARKCGMQPLSAWVACNKCIAFFASRYAAGLSRQSNKKQLEFLASVFQKHPTSGFLLAIHPFYLSRIFLGFVGYYRLRCGACAV